MHKFAQKASRPTILRCATVFSNPLGVARHETFYFYVPYIRLILLLLSYTCLERVQQRLAAYPCHGTGHEPVAVGHIVSAVAPKRPQLPFREVVHAELDGELGRRLEQVQPVAAPKPSQNSLFAVNVQYGRAKTAAVGHLQRKRIHFINSEIPMYMCILYVQRDFLAHLLLFQPKNA